MIGIITTALTLVAIGSAMWLQVKLDRITERRIGLVRDEIDRTTSRVRLVEAQLTQFARKRVFAAKKGAPTP